MQTGYLGIDPGLFGGLVYILEGGIRYKLVMPTITITKKNGDSKKELDRLGISSFLSDIPNHTNVTIEEQHPVRKQDINAICTTCKNYGIILMALHSAHLFVTEVTAKDWQDFYGIVSVKKAKGKTTKQQALPIAQSLFSGVDFRKSDRSRIPHDGIVDAALIANYCQSLFPHAITKAPSDAYLNWCDEQGLVEER